jgi:hypothetical protein
MMSEDDFWVMVALLDWERQGDDKAVIASAVQELAARPREDIRQFEEWLAFLVYQLDTKEHARNIGEDAYRGEQELFSPDGFLYARCVVVANGKELFKAVLRDPKLMPEDMKFEALLSIAPNAYELKTGDEFESVAAYSYETFSNVELAVTRLRGAFLMGLDTQFQPHFAAYSLSPPTHSAAPQTPAPASRTSPARGTAPQTADWRACRHSTASRLRLCAPSARPSTRR